MKERIQALTIKHWRKLLLVLCAMVMIIVGVVIGMDSLKKKEVSAHPTNTITLDEGGSNEFELPVDGTQLEEQALRDLSPQFDDFIQGSAYVPIANKSNVTAYGSNAVNNNLIYWFINDVKKTDYGNNIVLFGATGTDRGGLIKVSVFNKQGIEIATRVTGTLTNTTLRVATGFYEEENNRFLLGTNTDRYYRCTISNESSTSATINFVSINTTGTTSQQLKVANTRKITTNERINGKPIITGGIYPNQQAIGGYVNGRISVGSLENQNWFNGNITGYATHEYSLENLTLDEVGGFNGLTSDNIEVVLFINDAGMKYGTFRYRGADSTKNRHSVQIFSNEDTLVNGQTLKKRKYSFVEDNPNNELAILNEVSTNEELYYLRRTTTETQIIKVNLNTFEDSLVRSFPSDTRLMMLPNDDGSISYYGSTSSLEGEFYSPYYSSIFNSPFYYIQGLMDGMDTQTPAKVRSIRAIEVENWINPSHVVSISDNELLMGGTLTDYQKFADKTLLVAANGNTTNAIPSNTGAFGAFIGKITISDDFSPVIKQAPSISINTNDSAIINPTDSNYRGWNTLDRWLITGSKNGLVTDTSAIKVYDHFDSNDISISGTAAGREEWLQKRINRNPNDINGEIEWGKLGFDGSTAGSQLVTYFVADTQGQPGVTSRWVNKISPQTKEEGDHALDAQNFYVPLSEIDATIPNADKFKELAKTMAWNKTDGTTDEDGTDSSKLSTKVTVDTDQLDALREAKTAKPYPVDVTYKPKLGVEIVNRVWVFVTTKNTIPNSEPTPEISPQDTNGVVMYADDYELPFRMRGTHTANDVLTRGNVRVFDYYDSTHETSAELPTLADAGKNASKLVVENLDVINNATQPSKVTPSIRYEWDGAIDANHKDGSITGNETRGNLDVTLTGNILLHVRQVVIDDSNELVVPKKGYVEIENRLSNNGTPVFDEDYKASLIVESGKLSSNPNFTDIGLSVEHLTDNADEALFSIVVPEFYEYFGYYSTTEQADPQGTSHQGQTNVTTGNLALSKSALNNEGEYWITLYLKPTEDSSGNAKSPQPYSWDYKKNDLGKIKTK